MNISNLIASQPANVENLNACRRGRNCPIEQFSELLESEISSTRDEILHASEGVIGDEKRKKTEGVENCPPALLIAQFKQSNSLSAYFESADVIHNMEDPAIGECIVSPSPVGIVDLVLVVGVLRSGQKAEIEHGKLLDASNSPVTPEPKQSEIMTIKEDEPKDIREEYLMDLCAPVTGSAALPKYTQNLNVDSANRPDPAKFIPSIPNESFLIEHSKVLAFPGNAVDEILLRLNIDKENSVRFKIVATSEKLEFKLTSTNQALVEFFTHKIETLFYETLPKNLNFFLTSAGGLTQPNLIDITRDFRGSSPEKRNNSRRSDRSNPLIANDDSIATNRIDITSRVISI